MASVIHEISLDASAEAAWGLLGDPGAAHRAFAGVLTACVVDGDVRTVTFANGANVREKIVTLDVGGKRIAYAVIEGRFSHHAASMQIVAEGSNQSRFIWTNDFLPADAEPLVRGLVVQGSQAFKQAVEGEARSRARS